MPRIRYPGGRGRTVHAVHAIHPVLRTGRAGGFIYLWMLLAIATLQLGLAAATAQSSLASRRQQEQELLAIGRQFVVAIASYHHMGAGQGMQRYPATLEDLLLDPRAPGVRRHLRKVFIDPMTGKAEWGLLREGGRIIGVHSLSTRRPIKQAGFGALLDDGARASYAEWVFQYRGELSTWPDGNAIPSGEK